MKTICKYLMNTLDLDQETYDVIYYGLYVLVTNLISIISVMVIGYLLDELINTIVLLISFGPIRLYIGGYHASSPLKCYIYFNIISFLFILMTKMNINEQFIYICLLILLITVFIQVIKDKKDLKVIMILVAYFMISLFFHHLYYKAYTLGVLMAICLYEVKYIFHP